MELIALAAAITVAAAIIVPQDIELLSAIIEMLHRANWLHGHTIITGMILFLGGALAVSGLIFFGHTSKVRNPLPLMVGSIALEVISILGMAL